MKRLGVCAVLMAAVLGSGMLARATVPRKEDLSACKLPHGELLIPSPDAAESAKGAFVRFSDGSSASLPMSDTGKMLAPAVSAAKLRSSGKADIGYVSDDDGTLWVLSGKAMDLGTSYLHDAAGMKLTEPLEMKGLGGKPSGLYTSVEEGRTFLVQTSDGHYALMRVLDKSATGLRVQYVYQPAGGMEFKVPEGSLVSYSPAPGVPEAGPATEPAVVVTAPLVTPVKVAVAEPVHSISTPDLGQKPRPTVLEPYMYTFIEQRKMLIQHRLEKLAKEAKTPGDVDDKVQAIEDLVNLHAEEAATELATQISFVDSRRGSKDFSQDTLHPCFAAMKKMGRPAVDAALKELSTMAIVTEQQEENTDSPLYRAKLLGGVVRAVEGNDVAEFILKREREATTDANRKALYDVVIAARN